MSNPLLEGLERTLNTTAHTQNGALSNKSSLSDCVDLFGKIGAFRQWTESDIIDQFERAFIENPTKALKILFWCRDIRGGAGERKVPRIIFKHLAETRPEVMSKNLEFIPEFGRWDDLWILLDTPLKDEVLALVVKQFSEDYREIENKGKPSILLKWIPSENASSKLTKRYGTIIRKSLNLTSKQYRKTLSKGREYLKIVERSICSKEYKNIDYSKVPSRASMIYRNAFSKNDNKRYAQYLSDVEEGKVEIKSSTLYPYDIVRSVDISSSGNSNSEKTLDLQWKNLPNYVEPFNGMVICDTSGSMTVGRGSVRPIDVAVSLAMYIAERNTGIWENKFLTFSEDSQLNIIKGETLKEKLRSIYKADWGFSTNFQSSFDRILEVALENDLKDEDLPTTLFCISDMQFNEADSKNTNFKTIETKFKNAGYKMPQLVFWNVNAHGDSPVTIDDKGTALVSGCSPSILQSVLSGEIISPVDIMNNTIEVERYDSITK